MKIIEKAAGFKSRTAIVSKGKSYSYRALLHSSAAIASNILANKSDLLEKRIAFLTAPSFEYTAVQWGIWRAGGIAVPLCVMHPIPAMKYVVEDTNASIIIADDSFKEVGAILAKESGIPLVTLDSLLVEAIKELPEITSERKAMILYTSGTTSKPKGVVTRHQHIEAQI
ncbi:MAG: AMP-binding protein, partial [Flavobacteriaceae bacterium]